MPRAIVRLACLMLVTGCSGAKPDGIYTGYVEAEFSYIGAPSSGWLQEIGATEGSYVSAGDVLFKLDDDSQRIGLVTANAQSAEAGARAQDASVGARPEEISVLEAKSQEARAQLKLATADLERGRKLADSGAISPAALEELETRAQTARASTVASEDAVRVARLAAREGVRQAASAARSAAEAGVAQAQWRLEQRTILAPSNGHVDTLLHRHGEYVVAGSPVIAFLPDNAMKVRFFVPQSDLPGLSPGSVVQVSADGMDGPLGARISYVAPDAEFTPPIIYSAASRDRLVFAVEARLPDNSSLRPGVPVDVSVR